MKTSKTWRTFRDWKTLNTWRTFRDSFRSRVEFFLSKQNVLSKKRRKFRLTGPSLRRRRNPLRLIRGATWRSWKSKICLFYNFFIKKLQIWKRANFYFKETCKKLKKLKKKEEKLFPVPRPRCSSSSECCSALRARKSVKLLLIVEIIPETERKAVKKNFRKRWKKFPEVVKKKFPEAVKKISAKQWIRKNARFFSRFHAAKSFKKFPAKKFFRPKKKKTSIKKNRPKPKKKFFFRKQKNSKKSSNN